MFKRGFLINYIIFSFAFCLVIVFLHYFNFSLVKHNLLDDLLLWGILFPLTYLGTLWFFMKRKYLKYKSENLESKLI